MGAVTARRFHEHVEIVAIRLGRQRVLQVERAHRDVYRQLIHHLEGGEYLSQLPLGQPERFQHLVEVAQTWKHQIVPTPLEATPKKDLHLGNLRYLRTLR